MNVEDLAMLQEVKGYVDTVTKRLIKANKCNNEEEVKELQIKFTEEFNGKHGTSVGWPTFYTMLDAWMEPYTDDTLWYLSLNNLLDEFGEYLLYTLEIRGKL